MRRIFGRLLAASASTASAASAADGNAHAAKPPSTQRPKRFLRPLMARFFNFPAPFDQIKPVVHSLNCSVLWLSRIPLREARLNTGLPGNRTVFPPIGLRRIFGVGRGHAMTWRWALPPRRSGNPSQSVYWGILSNSPSLSADWWETTPATDMLSAQATFTSGVRSWRIAVTNSSIR